MPFLPGWMRTKRCIRSSKVAGHTLAKRWVFRLPWGLVPVTSIRLGSCIKADPAQAFSYSLLRRPEKDVVISGHDYSFEELHGAQADADLAVLSDLGRRVARVNLGQDPAQGLIEFSSVLEVALLS